MDKMRKQKILEKLDENGYIMVGTISKILGCTEVTLRLLSINFLQFQVWFHQKSNNASAMYLHKHIQNI